MINNRFEFVVGFYSFSVLQAQDPEYFKLLTSNLSAEQQKGLNEVILRANQKKAEYYSKQIEKQGGNTSVLAKVSPFTLA